VNCVPRKCVVKSDIFLRDAELICGSGVVLICGSGWCGIMVGDNGESEGEG
jgi:hypothetical protein